MQRSQLQCRCRQTRTSCATIGQVHEVSNARIDKSGATHAGDLLDLLRATERNPPAAQPLAHDLLRYAELIRQFLLAASVFNGVGNAGTI
jgi:hypothetical protein